MTYQEKITTLAEINTEKATQGELILCYYAKQYKYFSRLSTSELNAEFDKLKDSMEDFR
jgi:hypothetical protein